MGFHTIHKQKSNNNYVLIGAEIPFPNNKYKNASTFPIDYDKNIVDYIYKRYTKVYASDLDRSYLTASQSKKTICIPIGIDFHTIEKGPKWGEKQNSWENQLKQLIDIRKEALPLEKRDHRILLTWEESSDTSKRHTPTYMSRPDLLKLLNASPNCKHFTGSRINTWKEMAKHSFVYSPLGVGLDCHRLWEALALGCIVIVQSNPCAAEFVDRFPIILHTPELGVPSYKQLLQFLSKYKSTKISDMSMRNFINQEF
jgi:hypothetical protein